MHITLLTHIVLLHTLCVMVSVFLEQIRLRLRSRVQDLVVSNSEFAFSKRVGEPHEKRKRFYLVPNLFSLGSL